MSQPVLRLSGYADAGVRGHATVVSTRRITPQSSPEEVRELVLELERPEFPWAVGQSIGVYAPGDAAFGQAHHFRLYSVADLPTRGRSGRPRVTIAVRRCDWVDPYSGEAYRGVASHFLCDRRPGDVVEVAGPYGIPFDVPEDHDATLILIGSGTGIAPFRAFVKHLHEDVPDWTGRVWLFHGARSGLELLYMNDEDDDFAQYYDRATFEAFAALSARPLRADPVDWEAALRQRGDAVWQALGDPKTHVYVAGLERTRKELDRAFAALAGSPAKWARRKAELVAGGRWIELLY